MSSSVAQVEPARAPPRAPRAPARGARRAPWRTRPSTESTPPSDRRAPGAARIQRAWSERALHVGRLVREGGGASLDPPPSAWSWRPPPAAVAGRGASRSVRLDLDRQVGDALDAELRRALALQVLLEHDAEADHVGRGENRFSSAGAPHPGRQRVRLDARAGCRRAPTLQGSAMSPAARAPWKRTAISEPMPAGRSELIRFPRKVLEVDRSSGKPASLGRPR